MIRFSFVMILLLTGCAGQGGSYEDTEPGQLLTFHCEDGFTDCQRDAIAACGKRGFTEVDRFSPGGVTTAGRHIDQQNALSQGTGVYSESVRAADGPVSLSVRCN